MFLSDRERKDKVFEATIRLSSAHLAAQLDKEEVDVPVNKIVLAAREMVEKVYEV